MNKINQGMGINTCRRFSNLRQANFLTTIRIRTRIAKMLQSKKKEHERRQLSILQKHDTAAYEAWLDVSHHYTLLLQQTQLNELHIDSLTQQNETLSKINMELTLENTRLVDQSLEYENEVETLLGELDQIQHQLINGVDTDALVCKIQEILTKIAIKKHGYV